MRGRCYAEGYESVALIPLYTGNKRIGLLQFNDRQRNRFDDATIAFFERLAANLTIGLLQLTTADALRESEEKYRSRMESLEEATYICSSDFQIEFMNPALIKKIGRDATGEICHRAIHGLETKYSWCLHDTIMKGESCKTELAISQNDEVYFVSHSPIFHTNGTVSKLTIYRDITEQKKMEARIQQAQKMESIGTLAGGGIEPSVMDKIFEPYFTTKGEGKGTGLGLSVVYGIVKKHNGDVQIHSELNKGTTVKVLLPLAEDPTVDTPDTKANKVPTGSERIMLIDDEEPVLHLERQVLERLGYQVSTYGSGISALETFRSKPDNFDLVVTDMTMPNITGDKLAMEMIAIRPDIPVVICTGFSERINEKL